MENLMEEILEASRKSYIAALLSNASPEYVERKRAGLEAALKMAGEV